MGRVEEIMETYITHSNTKFVEIKRGEPGFMMNDGFTLVPRASINISPFCPDSVKQTIRQAFADGHLEMIAYVKEKDFMWETLGG